MQITTFGNTFIKLLIKSPQVGDSVLFIDPYEVKTWGGRQPKMEAHVTLFTSPPDSKKLFPDDSFIITEAGEYETKEIAIYGKQVVTEKAENKHTVYVFNAEGMQCAHLGHLPTATLTSDARELLEGVDILFIPVGGAGSLTGKQAANLVQELEPRVVIPMHYKFKGAKTTASDESEFMKELGNPKVEVTNKITIKKKDLPSEETKIILLHP